MKKFYLLFCCTICLSTFSLQAQMSILFIDDSDDTFGNAEALYAAILDVGYQADYFDAGLVGVGPLATDMGEYDLVVWHTSTDGGELYLWNQLDEENTELKTYLDTGGKLWLVGHDFLFDRYVSPYIFTAGEFVYDYLGINSYDGQSFVDDGGLGVEVINPVEDAPISGIEDFVSMFTTYYYGDVVSVREDAESVYVMGGATYPLAGETAAVYHNNENFQVLTYLFDLSLGATPDLIRTNTLAVLNHFNNLLTSTQDVLGEGTNARVYPNPVIDHLKLQIHLNQSSHLTVGIFDVHGRKLAQPIMAQVYMAGEHYLEIPLAAATQGGYYYLRIETNEGVFSKPFIVNK